MRDLIEFIVTIVLSLLLSFLTPFLSIFLAVVLWLLAYGDAGKLSRRQKELLTALVLGGLLGGLISLHIPLG